MSAFWPRSAVCVRTQTHTHVTHTPESRLLHEEMTPRDVDKDWESKWILQNIQVRQWLSVRQLQSVPADWLTDGPSGRQTGRARFPQVAPWSGPQVAPTPPAADLILPNSLFRQMFWFQAALLLRVQMDNSAATSRGCSVHRPQFDCQWLSPECKKVARVTGGCRWDGCLSLSLSLREPVESAESLGDEVEESPAGVSPVLPVRHSLLWEKDGEMLVQMKQTRWIIQCLTFLGEPRC